MRILLSPLLLFAACFLASGQTAREALSARPELAAGIYNLTREPFSEPTKAPKGYKPFYLSHYARHGARYMVSENYYTRLLKPLEAAHAAGRLTPLGDTLYARASRYYAEHAQYRAGELTPLGWRQHKQIAGELLNCYPDVFRQAPLVHAVSTQYHRCIMSMSAFCIGLKEKAPSLNIYEEALRRTLPVMNPRDKSNPFPPHDIPDQAPWGQRPEEFAAQVVDADAIFGRIFSDTAFGASLVDPLRFSLWLYHHIYDAECDGTPYTLLDLPLLTADEAYALWSVENLDCWYVSGLASRIYLPVLRDIVETADDDLAADRPPVRLRFGHDTTIQALLTLMDADGFGKVPAAPQDLADSWQNYRTPMASTLVFVFYRNPKRAEADVLFKVLLDGKELCLPLTPVQGPYYRWEDFRTYVRVLSDAQPDGQESVAEGLPVTASAS